MNVPFFSVIIPVYNKEPFVARAIKSVLNQSFKDFEVLIVCDPSSDNSNKEVEKFNDSRIRIFYRDEPGPGGYAARNLGIKNSNAEWITFLDADDEWYNDHLENAYKAISEFPNIKLFTSGRKSIYNDKIKLDNFSKSQDEKYKILTFKDYLRFSIKRKRPIGTNSVVANKNILPYDDWFPDGKTNRSGDLYLWVLLTASAKKFVWSSHIASVSYREVVGVSKINIPSIDINHEMVNLLKDDLNKTELILLKKYANRLIRTAWFEHKRTNNVNKCIAKEFFWEKDFLYCLFWTFISFLPYNIYYKLKAAKKL